MRKRGGGHIRGWDRIGRDRTGDCQGSQLAGGNRNFANTFLKPEMGGKDTRRGTVMVFLAAVLRPEIESDLDGSGGKDGQTHYIPRPASPRRDVLSAPQLIATSQVIRPDHRLALFVATNQAWNASGKLPSRSSLLHAATRGLFGKYSSSHIKQIHVDLLIG